MSPTDLPCVSAKEAGEIFGCSGPTFKTKDREVLHLKSYRMTGSRTRYRLSDVVQAAHPDANKQTVALIGARFLMNKMNNRKNKLIEKRRGES